MLRGIPSGFRNVPGEFQRRAYATGDRELVVGYRFGREGLELEQLPDDHSSVIVLSAEPDHVVMELDGVRRQYAISRFTSGEVTSVVVDGSGGSVTLARMARFIDPSTQAHAGALVAPMPGTVVRVAVEAGSRVEAGQQIAWAVRTRLGPPRPQPARWLWGSATWLARS